MKIRLPEDAAIASDALLYFVRQTITGFAEAVVKHFRKVVLIN